VQLWEGKHTLVKDHLQKQSKLLEEKTSLLALEISNVTNSLQSKEEQVKLVENQNRELQETVNKQHQDILQHQVTILQLRKEVDQAALVKTKLEKELQQAAERPLPAEPQEELRTSLPPSVVLLPRKTTESNVQGGDREEQDLETLEELRTENERLKKEKRQLEQTIEKILSQASCWDFMFSWFFR
jgi:hypothetical protein